MEVITKQDKIVGAAKNWRAQYYIGRKWRDIWHGNSREIWQQLKALSPDAIEQDVTAIIGNATWTENACSECGEDSDMLIQLGQPPDDDSNTVYICPKCLKRALALVGEQ